MKNRHYRLANLLALFTIFYNLAEGVVSVWMGSKDETLALFGFGIDSFIEVISAVGIWHLVQRVKSNGGESKDEFERKALRITGSSFYLLSAGLVISAIINLIYQNKPETTFWGIVISLVSI